MNDKLNVINRFLLDNDSMLADGELVHLFNNKSIWVKLFFSFIRYEGNIRRVKYPIMVNNKVHNSDSLAICYFINGESKSFILAIENGIIRLSDAVHNNDFEMMINVLYRIVCKFNIYDADGYNSLCKEIKAYGVRRNKVVKKSKKKAVYSVKPIKRK